MGNSMGSAAAIFAAGELGKAGHGNLFKSASELYTRTVLDFIRDITRSDRVGMSKRKAT